MLIELQDEIESVRFEVNNKEVVGFIKNRLDRGKNFEVFFPDYEV